MTENDIVEVISEALSTASCFTDADESKRYKTTQLNY